MLESIKQESIAEQVAERLRQAIEDGSIQAGTRLTEQEICDQMSVSRTPVREAFRILQVEGYLTYRPRFGVIVTELSMQDLYDAWEVRMNLEEMVARKTARLADDNLKNTIRGELKAIEAVLKQKRIREEQFTVLDEKYYEIHISNCGNKKLEETARSLRVSSAIMRRKSKFSEERARVALHEISEIYNAYLNNDEEKAVLCNRAHFDASLEEIKRYM